MNASYFRSSFSVTGDKALKLSQPCPASAGSLDRFSYVSRLISGSDDEFLRKASATFSQMEAHRRFRHAIYRRSLNCFRRDYRRLEAQALAGMQDRNVSIDEILTSRWRMNRELAKLEFAGLMYRFGIPAGDRVRNALRSLQQSLTTSASASVAIV